ncbi:MAG: Fe-S protein assembly co-chaperone HscB [Alphaproteobacteria bacterium 41-28]|nr:MAG: Fe-S protein assembly co-chaperone HscB [Alphaproteobacteria bacterium 41-28]
MFDPFEVFGFEKHYSLDVDSLEKRYFEEQKKTHPDRFALSSEAEKDDALRKSTALNQAYIILKDPLQRASFLLKVKGVEPLSHDPLFLGEVMEWNDRLEAGEDLSLELRQEEEKLLKNLETAFEEKDDESARVSLYRLTYVRKLLKDNLWIASSLHSSQ